MTSDSTILKAYEISKEQYAAFDVDAEQALDAMRAVSLSLHCWQGDDVGGFEKPDSALAGGGIQVTGSYPGKARTIDELRSDLKKAYSLIPGRHRLNLHAIYGEFGGRRIDRDGISFEHFNGWVDWVKSEGLKLDFNATCFSHPKADSGFTLSNKNKEIRKFWVEHVRRCREISSYIGRTLNDPCIHNLWIPDGSKDTPVDRWTHRVLLKNSLDEIFAEEYKHSEMKDAIESKLFGIGSESFVVGSHEFYLGYALTHGKILCLDMGHFHPTESIADKLSALLQYFDELLLHVSRGVRWDSDHVVILNDDVRSVAEELVRCNALRRVHVALDFFDASMNRVGAWVIGARATLKSVLAAVLQPHARLKDYEETGNYFARLALLEEVKSLPFGAVWNYYCLSNNVPPADKWMKEIAHYEAEVTGKRK